MFFCVLTVEVEDTGVETCSLAFSDLRSEALLPSFLAAADYAGCGMVLEWAWS